MGPSARLLSGHCSPAEAPRRATSSRVDRSGGRQCAGLHHGSGPSRGGPGFIIAVSTTNTAGHSGPFLLVWATLREGYTARAGGGLVGYALRVAASPFSLVRRFS